MSHAVFALGAGVLCASGCVWYLPAALDVRAGADRPLSRRLTALACLTGWGTLALVAVVLLLPVPWSAVGAVAGAGAVAAGVLLVLALDRRVREQREEERRWAALYGKAPAPDPARAPARGPVVRGAGPVQGHVPGAGPGPRRAQYVFLLWVLCGVALAGGTAVTVLLAGGPASPARTAVAIGAAVAVTVVCLVVASVHAAAVSRRLRACVPPRSPAGFRPPARRGPSRTAPGSTRS
ncbi:hypothetical protein [Streptomyces sp. MST-110588]|uniref:hypothetical protein n=1 Tax=Streptomyces sp. MST-110588 TaxID=2833628 RepID=UPI001F5D8EC2|nr:hypothetical protein [Streptomyces sp. MST-110588]UNO40807.1 hypothetical protein KGS77_15985 [Streptomyces sp. MST-110588]